MEFRVDYRNVELYSGASYGFKGFFDEEGNESWKSKTMTDEDYRNAQDWTATWMNKIYKSDTLADFVKGIPVNIAYYLEIQDNEIVFAWTCPNGLNGEYTFGFGITAAELS